MHEQYDVIQCSVIKLDSLTIIFLTAELTTLSE